MDDVELRARYDESVEAERTLGLRLADEVVAFQGIWTPNMTALALQIREQRRASNALRRQLVVEIAG